MATASQLVAIDALAPHGAYRARERQVVENVRGSPVAELSLVPRLYVTRALAALREAKVPSAANRLTSIARAGEFFRTQRIDGLSPTEHDHLVSQVSGMPIAAVRTAGERLAAQAVTIERNIEPARPSESVDDWRDPLTRTGRAVWTRRGDVFGVHAPGNNPGVHAIWLEALALGYKVAVRPSSREPFTPYRLVSALRAAGLGEQVALLPTTHEVSDELVQGADLSIVFGGESVVRRYEARQSVLVQGPGRSKILLTRGVDWRPHLEMVVHSICHEGGTACVNTTAVFVEGDPSPVAEAIAGRLSELPSLPPEDERAVLPVLPLDRARQVERRLLRSAAGTLAWLGGDGVVDDLGDGSAVLRPAVHQLDRSSASQARVELPFPSVWVAPWSEAAGVEPLKDSLVLSALTDDEYLLDQLLAEPTIANLYIGGHVTCQSEQGLPHDGYLAAFLMRTKTVLR